MRGIVAEINGKYAIILAQDGSFKKTRAVSHMAVGSEIDLDQPSANIKVARLVSRVSAVAAGALFILGIGYGAYSYTVPYSYVDVDINPSIELTMNIYDRIIKTEALNDDGKKILESRDLKNSSLESGISQILCTALEQGYLKAEIENEGGSGSGISVNGMSNETNMDSGGIEPIIKNAVLLTVASSSGGKSEVLAKKLSDMAVRKLEKNSVSSEVLVGEASVTQRNDARILGVTPGKLVLIEDALEGEPELKLEDLKEASVRELLQKAKDKKAEMEKQKAESEEKQKEELRAASGNTEYMDNGKSDNEINNNRNSEPEESGIDGQKKATLQERLSEQLDILKSLYRRNRQNNGTDTKDESDSKYNETEETAGSGNQTEDNNTGNSSGNGSSNKSKVTNKSISNNINSNKDNYNMQDAVKILQKQKKEMQQLKEELLKQLLNSDTAGKSEQSQIKPKTTDNNTSDSQEKKNNNGGNNGKKK